MTRDSRRRRTDGFTLIEVLLVLVILVVLGSMAGVAITGTQDKALKNAARAQIGIFDRQVEQYRFDTKQYPSALEDLTQKPSDSTLAERWAGPYIKGSKLPLDPWDKEYKYKVDGESYRIWSTGPDGQDGSDDDIANEDPA